jgi:hypothetical protein
MPLTQKETAAVKNGESGALARALITSGVSVSVTRCIASGDTQALSKALGLTGPQARAVLDGDSANIPAAILGKL